MDEQKQAEKILKSIRQKEAACRRLNSRILTAAFCSGPSGYVGQSVECRGSGMMRKSRSGESAAGDMLYNMMKKNKIMEELRLIGRVFSDMKNAREGRLIYLRFGRELSTEQCAQQLGISRRQYHRRYKRALLSFYQKYNDELKRIQYGHKSSLE